MHRLSGIFKSLAVVSGLVASSAANAADVSVVRFGADAARTRIVVESDQALDYAVFTLAGGGDRLVLDLESVRWALDDQSLANGERGGDGAGLVARYRYGAAGAERSRLVFDLTDPAGIVRQFRLPPTDAMSSHRLVIDLNRVDRRTFDQTATASAAVPMAGEADGASARNPFVIVIDPGHGGYDPGAHGAANLQEKEVNLAVAEMLAERLRRNGRYRVVVTRSDDSFVSLLDRVRIAREAQADLFLSLHANSATGGVRGAAVYTLAQRAEGRSRTEILSEQNWLIDADLDDREPDVADILVDLAQRETQSQSGAFADLLIPRLRAAGPVLRNARRAESLFVLLAPDVPTVLVELGFLSNAGDEALLATTRHRGRLADALKSGIDDYFDQRAVVFAAR